MLAFPGLRRIIISDKLANAHIPQKILMMRNGQILPSNFTERRFA